MKEMIKSDQDKFSLGIRSVLRIKPKKLSL